MSIIFRILVTKLHKDGEKWSAGQKKLTPIMWIIDHIRAPRRAQNWFELDCVWWRWRGEQRLERYAPRGGMLRRSARVSKAWRPLVAEGDRKFCEQMGRHRRRQQDRRLCALAEPQCAAMFFCSRLIQAAPRCPGPDIISRRLQTGDQGRQLRMRARAWTSCWSLHVCLCVRLCV